jgi:hypothetical protein
MSTLVVAIAAFLAGIGTGRFWRWGREWLDELDQELRGDGYPPEMRGRR